LGIFISLRARFINKDELQLNVSKLVAGNMENFTGTVDL